MTCPQFADQRGPHNPSPILSPAIRLAVLAGSLTPARIDARLAEAEQRGVSPVAVFTAAELHHMLFIQQSLPPGATCDDVIATIRAVAGA